MATPPTPNALPQRPLSCAAANRFIIDYLEEILPPQTRTRFETHLAECPACDAYFQQYLHTVDWIREDGSFVIDPPEELVEKTLYFLREHYDDLENR